MHIKNYRYIILDEQRQVSEQYGYITMGFNILKQFNLRIWSKL